MNYYDEIKRELLDNEVNRKVKTYSINKSDLDTYYNVGKMLSEAGKHYGESIIKEYSKKLMLELGKKYSITLLKYMRQFYVFSKSHPVGGQLTFSHYKLLLPIKDNQAIDYYIEQSVKRSLSKRQLQEIIKNKEYERLPEETKNKLIVKEKPSIKDYIKEPILIKNSSDYDVINEKILQRLILEDIPGFLKELGNGFTFIDNEYKIKIGDRYNYIDLHLYNIKYRCYVVIELKVTELKKQYIGQIETYMNYVDKNVKSTYENKTIGIIICKKNNEFIMEYCSDKRILAKEFKVVN